MPDGENFDDIGTMAVVDVVRRTRQVEPTDINRVDVTSDRGDIRLRNDYAERPRKLVEE